MFITTKGTPNGNSGKDTFTNSIVLSRGSTNPVHDETSFGLKSFNKPTESFIVFQGLRVTLISGAATMTAGSWIKVMSASPDRFYLAFLGQVFVGTAQIFILGVPARLAAVWFPPRQVSTACSLGVFGNQVRNVGFTIYKAGAVFQRQGLCSGHSCTPGLLKKIPTPFFLWVYLTNCEELSNSPVQIYLVVIHN